MKCSIQPYEAELNEAFHLSQNAMFALLVTKLLKMRKHSYLSYTTCKKDSNFQTKAMKNDLYLKQNIIQVSNTIKEISQKLTSLHLLYLSHIDFYMQPVLLASVVEQK